MLASFGAVIQYCLVKENGSYMKLLTKSSVDYLELWGSLFLGRDIAVEVFTFISLRESSLQPIYPNFSN